MLRDFPLPPSLAGAGRPTGPPVPVRPAATVMLVRDGGAVRSGRENGVEVFAFRRVRAMVFAAGMLVFPGGAEDDQDGDPDLPWAGPRPADPGPARAVVTAVRETFEECGVLLAAGPAPADPAAVERARRELLAGAATIAQVLRRFGLAVDAQLLHPWARWVTPEFEPRRFDTVFFLARVPPGQLPRDVGDHPGAEGEGAGWRNAADAVRAHHAGQLPMLPPTLVCLEELAAADGVAQLEQTPRRPRPVSPWPVEVDLPDGTRRLVLRVDLDGAGGGEPRQAGP